MASRPRSIRPTGRTTVYIAVRGKPPGATLTPEEYALHEPLWIEWLGKNRGRKGA